VNKLFAIFFVFVVLVIVSITGLSAYYFKDDFGVELKGLAFPIYYEQDERRHYLFLSSSIDRERSYTVIITDHFFPFKFRYLGIEYNTTPNAAHNLEGNGYDQEVCPSLISGVAVDKCFGLDTLHYYIGDDHVIHTYNSEILDWI
jgi:hypothetical protein